MHKQLFLFFLIAALALAACTVNMESVRGSRTVASEARPVAGIRGVTLATLGDMTIELGEQESLTIAAEDNLLPYLETEVRGGILTIHNTAGKSLLPTKPVRYYLTVTSLETLETTSSGNIAAPAMQADRFTAAINSSGDLHLAGITADRLEVEISSSGDLTIDAGQIVHQEVTLSSSGNYKADDVRCQVANVRLSSSGQATLWVTDKLDANLSSSGNVNYYGRPEISESTSSSGKVVSLGSK